MRLWSATEVKRMYPQIQRRAEDAARGRADAYANDDDENKSSSDRSNKNKEDSSSSGSNTAKTQPTSNSTASLARDLTHPASTCAEAEAIEEEEEEGEEVEHEQPLAKSAVDSSLWHSPARFPLFSRVPFSEATLGPGQSTIPLRHLFVLCSTMLVGESLYCAPLCVYASLCTVLNMQLCPHACHGTLLKDARARFIALPFACLGSDACAHAQHVGVTGRRRALHTPRRVA